ncbi:MAG: hypothetical protein RMI39_00010 [Thermoanaerobaculum sp.]|nr:hypothetical protein [Thermoanaerobaculum sp.]
MAEERGFGIARGALGEVPRKVTGSLAVLGPGVLLQAARAAKRDLRLSMRQQDSGQVVVLVFRRGEPTMVFSPGDGRSVGEMLVAAGLLDQVQLARLLEERRTSSISLERLLTERTPLTHDMVQRFLDFQARLRLLDALSWQQGFFELAEYAGGGETTYRLQLPSIEALQNRAKSRATRLPGLLGRLPAPPAHVFVRRRRGADPPVTALGREIYELVAKPLLLPQLMARLLVDDDVLLEAVLDLVAAKALVIYPRLELAPGPRREGVTGDLWASQMVEEVLRRFRGGDGGGLVRGLWIVVVACRSDEAARLVSRLGGEPEELIFRNSEAPVALLARSVAVGPNARLHLLALQPDVLSPAALAGILGRCDAVVLLRGSANAEEEHQLAKLRQVAEGAGFGWRPLIVGVDLGATFRPWEEYPEAVLGIPSIGEAEPQWLAKRLLEALLAAAAARH